MIIPINLSPSPDSSDCTFPPQLAQLGTSELVILEMQGSFHVEGDASADLVKEAKGKMIAKLTIDADKKPTLLVGHNLLEGKVVTLQKPLAVLHRKPSCAVMEGMDVDWHDDPHGERSNDSDMNVEYDMVALITKKLLFSKRPMPIVKMAGAGAQTTSA